jgi:predicted DCC family thiol-disulfide oxidoreductase YuxK
MGSSDPLAGAAKQPLILFDGVCNLCNASVQFIIRHDPHRKFKFASLRSPVAKEYLKKFNLADQELSSILLIKNGKYYDRSNAALEIARDLKGLWKIFYFFKIIPAPLRNVLYNIIANNRYKLFGKKDVCMIPTPELRSRFIG